MLTKEEHEWALTKLTISLMDAHAARAVIAMLTPEKETLIRQMMKEEAAPFDPAALLGLSTNKPKTATNASKDDDGAEALAEKAYMIYRSMAQSPVMRPIPWDVLTRQERGMYTWIVRLARLHDTK